MALWRALLFGFAFGAGLVVSGMTNGIKVQGFLDLTGPWDPTLAFVMGGALLVTFPAFALARTLPKPWVAPEFFWPTLKAIDWRLIGGSVLFGAGWAVGGLCPGPALVNLGTLDPGIYAFVAAMLGGFWLHDRLLGPH